MSYDVSAGPHGKATIVRAADRTDAAGVEIVTDRAQWDRLIAAAAFPHLPQSYAYGEAKRAKGWTIRRVTFSVQGQVVAFCQLLERRVLGIRVITRINRGPLFLSPEPDTGIVRAVYAAIRHHWGRLHHGVFFMASALPVSDANYALLSDLGYWLRQRESWTSGRVDLSPDEAAIWASFASTFRNRVRNAEKTGAAVRVAEDAETFDWMIARHSENMREKHFHAVDGTFLHAFRATNPGDVLVFQLLLGGKPVAGMSVVRYGNRAEYHVGWFGPEGRKANAGNVLMWAIMREMKRRGCTQFDVGGLKEGAGYTQFKRTMNPAEYHLAGEWMAF